MSGFLTDYWRDFIAVSGFLLTLLQVVLPISAKLISRARDSRSTPRPKMSSREGRSHQYSEDDVFWGKVIAACTIIVFIGSALLAPLDTPDVSGIRLLIAVLLYISTFGAAFIQVILLVVLCYERLMRKYPKIEDLLDNTQGFGTMALISWGLLISLYAVPAAEHSIPAWAFYIVVAYSLPVSTLSILGLVAGVIGAVAKFREILGVS
jgi:hypothetical protein